MPIVSRDRGLVEVNRAAFMRAESLEGRPKSEAEALTSQICEMLIAVADRLSPVLLDDSVAMVASEKTIEPPSSKLVQDLRNIRNWVESFDRRIAL